MRLSNKITLGATCVIVLSNLAVMGLVSRRNEMRLREVLMESARSYYKLVIVLRSWVSENEGVYVRRAPGREPNPYLRVPQVQTMAGDTLVWRNPAMVTREISELSRRVGVGVRFHLTSLRPVNPGNAPDAFETQALQTLIAGRTDELSPFGEFTRMETIKGVRSFRYFAPIFTESSCLPCHASQGYRPGSIRGGISIVLPVEPAAARAGGLFFTVLGALLVTIAISLVILWLLHRTIVRPLRRLENAAREIGHGNLQTEILTESRDEIGDVGRAMVRMQAALQKRVRKQVQTEKMVALGQLSAGIAHEIRNPLFALRNDLDYLQRRDSGEGQEAEVHRSMEEGLTRIGELVSSILDYARPHRPEFGNHTVAEVLGRCRSLMGKQMAKEHVFLDMELDPHLPPIEMDAHRLEQVFINLLANTMRARRGSEAHVRITGRPAGDGVEIRVADDGVGIAPADLQRIFDPFFSRSSEGTGLGLTIVRRIVEQHHGLIEVESEPGAGTVFTLRLPRVQPRQDVA